MPPLSSAANSASVSARRRSGGIGSDVSRVSASVVAAVIETLHPLSHLTTLPLGEIVEATTGVGPTIGLLRALSTSAVDRGSDHNARQPMIIQTAPAGTPRLAIMMYEHTALSGQFARAFGNELFEPLSPLEPMIYVVSNHDAGWVDFDRDPPSDKKTGLPYNLIETPAELITVTSRRSPEFNERHHPYCGLMSSMHSWGLYNGRYGLSNMVLIDKIPPSERPIAQRMLDAELERQKRLKEKVTKMPEATDWIGEKHLFQNY